VLRTRVRDNGLMVADIAWRGDLDADELRPQHGLLAMVLERVLEQAGGEHAQAPMSRFDDAAWICWRLAELLPLSDAQRQSLLQDDDPHARLDQLLGMMS
jgi:Lon protease-like protein